MFIRSISPRRYSYEVPHRRGGNSNQYYTFFLFFLSFFFFFFYFFTFSEENRKVERKYYLLIIEIVAPLSLGIRRLKVNSSSVDQVPRHTPPPDQVIGPPVSKLSLRVQLYTAKHDFLDLLCFDDLHNSKKQSQ